MAANSYHSRSMSWFVKSCIPADPDRHISVPVSVPAPVAASSTTSLCFPAQPPPPISALPDDLILECLVRVPRVSLPPLPAVCRRFADLLASHAFLQLRRARGQLQPSLLAVSVPDHGGAFAQALLQFRPEQQQLQVTALPLPLALLHCGRSVFAHVCAGSVDALHVASGSWARPRALPGGGCVVGACGVGDHLYVVASHAVELSFWRWHGGAGRGSDLRAGGGWVALEAPPMPRGSVGLGMAVRVTMAGIGRETVTAVMSAAAVRGHNAAGAGPFEGMVLAYDIAGGKWSRAPDLPPGFRRAACAGVEC
ncbi:unnamed protein product [Triticum turgidum subsp. durum]|uniref:F-box domain-containing protein n=1 Tax=Triticum turgidum subsp. durum TaxID=4567 RepID=A0A9R0WL79_TRITD|nr:unnamed protein product [Triticum turgidum subsp. durum]